MAEENRRVSTTPIPVPVPFGAVPPAPTLSPLNQTPAAVAPPVPEDTANATEATEGVSKDVAMTDADLAPSPAPAAAATPTPTPANATSGASPAPARTGTPLRGTGTGEATNSRAASQHPDPGFVMPAETAPHGAPVRQYLNTKVTGALLDGMKLIAKEQPKDPLRALGEYLLQRSKDIEGSA